MKIIEYKLGDNFPDTKGTVVALGNFDGMHLAHQEIAKVARSIAQAQALEFVILTFKPHPLQVLKPHHTLITPFDYKQSLMGEYHPSYIVQVAFDKQFAALNYKDFLAAVLQNQLNCKHLITGYNFYFGHNREGNAALLSHISRNYGFNYTAINQISYDGRVISTSNIKSLLNMGAVGRVSCMLGRPYKIIGNVFKGREFARQLGFPTANIAIREDVHPPALGVYLVRVFYNGKHHWGIANIGYRPTFEELKEQGLVLEVHLFKFKETLYNETLYVDLVQFIRPERKFNGVEQLKAQIQTDIVSAKYVIRKSLS